ncbi:XrtA system polysaccharide deacetylase [Corallincola platygyrae]|uniref:XrtA system polysaccharide deacetylase n=1 Tax=Corallincola platygyrae TaxID=1193278 RepID=A0ABW4XLM3_9GAMM
MSQLQGAMTIDVEDYFQVEAFAGIVKRSEWDNYERRVAISTRKALALFAEHDAKATFFILGWVAEREPELVREVVAAGHEVASHGYGHERVCGLTPEQFAADVGRAKKLLEDISGKAVEGYRAPCFSISQDNQWAHDIILEAGHSYSSSIYPIKHDLYGVPDAPTTPFRLPNGLIEIPASTLKMGGHNLPISGGGYFRLLPLSLTRWALKKHAREQGQVVFYFHPWELDTAQPRMIQASRKSKFRHYLNLERMEPRLSALLSEFNWQTMADLYLQQRDKYPVVDWQSLSPA